MEKVPLLYGTRSMIFYFQPGATMQGGGVTQKIIDSMKYAGTITDWAGKVHHINSLDDLKQYINI